MKHLPLYKAALLEDCLLLSLSGRVGIQLNDTVGKVEEGRFEGEGSFVKLTQMPYEVFSLQMI